MTPRPAAIDALPPGERVAIAPPVTAATWRRLGVDATDLASRSRAWAALQRGV